MRMDGSKIFGAGDRVRTGDINLGKVALYQLSYSRLRKDCFANCWLVDSSILSRTAFRCQIFSVLAALTTPFSQRFQQPHAITSFPTLGSSPYLVAFQHLSIKYITIYVVFN